MKAAADSVLETAAVAAVYEVAATSRVAAAPWRPLAAAAEAGRKRGAVLLGAVELPEAGVAAVFVLLLFRFRFLFLSLLVVVGPQFPNVFPQALFPGEK